jgi:hypothetical protein
MMQILFPTEYVDNVFVIIRIVKSMFISHIEELREYLFILKKHMHEA